MSTKTCTLCQSENWPSRCSKTISWPKQIGRGLWKLAPYLFENSAVGLELVLLSENVPGAQAATVVVALLGVQQQLFHGVNIVAHQLNVQLLGLRHWPQGDAVSVLLHRLGLKSTNTQKLHKIDVDRAVKENSFICRDSLPWLCWTAASCARAAALLGIWGRWKCRTWARCTWKWQLPRIITPRTCSLSVLLLSKTTLHLKQKKGDLVFSKQ